jgi:CheY-like chemotaxis protein
MSTAMGLVKDKPVELYQKIAPDLPSVKADPIKVRQVILNLISNAAKFTDEGSIIVKASQQIGPDGAPEIKVCVTDTGQGISPEDQKKLFQPFSQVDASPTRKTSGSGLGLSICRALVEMHGGKIGLESEPGKGSSFYFTLPLLDDAFIQEKLSSTSNTSSRIVLAVDTNRKVLDFYARHLQGHDFEVIPLTDPSRALEQARENQPFAITLDVQWPGHDGWQVLKTLKTDPATGHIPVIVCSMLEEKDKGLSLGASAYLTKPILGEDLANALNRLNGEKSA